MEFNHQVLTYGPSSRYFGTANANDELCFFSKEVGLVVKVDKEFSAEGIGMIFSQKNSVHRFIAPQMVGYSHYR